MKINLLQRTAEWYRHRKNFINASEVASITNLDPFRSVYQLIHDKIFGSTFTTNKYVEHGQKTEPIARQFFIQKTNLPFEDIIFTDDEFKIFSASLDGYNEKHKVVLEIKCPFLDENNLPSKSWNHFLQTKEVPKYYWCQVQCQLLCSQAKFCYFLVYFNDNNYHVVRIYPDKEYFQTMFQMGKKYLELLNLAKTELQNTTYLKKLSKFS